MMASKHSKPSFMSGIQYLRHLQNTGKPHCGLQMIDSRLEFGKTLYSKDLYAHYGCVNAIEFSNDGRWLVSGGDDKRVLMWNMDKTLSFCKAYQPEIMKGEHNSNIFCLAFTNSHTKLLSAGNDDQVILHNIGTSDVVDVFPHEDAVYGISADPLDENVFTSACDDGRVLVWDIRQSTRDALELASCTSAFHAVSYNPIDPRFIATANAKNGVCLWDVRKPKTYFMKYGPSLLSQSAMSVRFNNSGTHLLALRRRFPPVLYEITSSHPAAEFDHNEYYNSCTMKSCCFAGDRDQYILSGSDDFKLYVWRIPDLSKSKKGVWVNKAHLVLRGHRSIVNQVRYNYTYGALASSGVEKIVKLWSTFPLSLKDSEYISKHDQLRRVYSHEEYINLVLESGQFMTHDYSHHSVQEDPRMMAFFDSLVQRDIEGWTSDSSDTTDAMNTCFEVQSTDSMSSSSSSSDDDDADSNSERILAGRSSPSSSTRRSGNPDAEDLDSSLDKISILISKKRKQQMLKTKPGLKLVKRNGVSVIKKRKMMLRNQSLISGPPANGASTSQGNSSNLNSKDKRKILRKVKLMERLRKDSLLRANSSDSDENGSQDINLPSCSKSFVNDIKTDDCDLFKDRDEHSCSNPVVESVTLCNYESNDHSEVLDGGNVNPVQSISTTATTTTTTTTTNAVGGAECSDSAISSRSDSPYIFVLKRKHNGNRNYRKRNAEDD